MLVAERDDPVASCLLRGVGGVDSRVKALGLPRSTKPEHQVVPAPATASLRSIESGFRLSQEFCHLARRRAMVLSLFQGRYGMHAFVIFCRVPLAHSVHP